MFELTLALAFTVIALAFVAELVDSSLGMGYGTSLTPILIVLGFEPLEIVPAILLSELATGLLAAAFHHRHGNAALFPDLSGLHMPSALKKLHTRDGLTKARIRTPRDLKVGIILACTSVVGAVVAVTLAVSLPSHWVTLYIGIMVTIMGIIILLFRKTRFGFSWHRIAILGTVAAFNKGISGGGYGPIVTSGQLLAGVRSKSAIAITSLAESAASAAGVVAFLFLGVNLATPLTPYVLIGAVMSAPLSALVVARVKTDRLTLFIGSLTLILGLVTILKVLR